MPALLGLSRAIDRLLNAIAKVGMWAGLGLIFVVVYDVSSRYFGVPKPFGLNSTKVQEAEYWLHTYLFATMIGYAYTRQAHVRIDLLRDKFSPRVKFLVEIFGICLFLLPFAAIAIYYTGAYAYQSYLEGEVSKSVIGIPHSWLLKIALPMLFVLLGLAGVSQLIKSLAGLTGRLSKDDSAGFIGEET
ncbi:hypothetical protein MNBD_ALPHA09-797 [hydrothermal vent metagenome]|uniref:Tripartite ATP-independent periplasmic transporters DctQ component domain-containing protein n=1 Tax=hydrothermal vent metagenome TaxID=652676 RepID=A0A3B0U2H0_9ZZZZ